MVVFAVKWSLNFTEYFFCICWHNLLFPLMLIIIWVSLPPENNLKYNLEDLLVFIYELNTHQLVKRVKTRKAAYPAWRFQAGQWIRPSGWTCWLREGQSSPVLSGAKNRPRGQEHRGLEETQGYKVGTSSSPSDTATFTGSQDPLPRAPHSAWRWADPFPVSNSEKWYFYFQRIPDLSRTLEK